jgi:hypothetical protein
VEKARFMFDRLLGFMSKCSQNNITQGNGNDASFVIGLRLRSFNVALTF